MSKLIIAVCDTDGVYAERLGEWISLENIGESQGISFSYPECFLEYLNTQEPDIILLGKEFLEHKQVRELLLQQRVREESIKGYGKKRAMWLYLHGQEETTTLMNIEGLLTVEKYQPASQILREVFFNYQKWGGRTCIETDDSKEMIGIYSPGHSIWQTPFALTFAHALALREKVLYVNFKECAGFRNWFQEEYERDLLDVMYLCLNNEVNITDCINSALYTIEGIHYIPPAEDSGCLGEVAAQDYVKFVQLLKRKSSYDVILFDFGMMIPGFYQLLDLCSRVYIATEHNELHEGPLQQFRQMTERQTEIEFDQKFIYLTLPTVNLEISATTDKLQQWLWSSLGDFSREMAGVQSGAD